MRSKLILLGAIIFCLSKILNAQSERDGLYQFSSKGNPVITHEYTADPAALVEDDTLWLYTGHDFEGGQKGYKLRDWLVFSTTDMKHWTEYPVPLKITDFSWAESGDAYAGQVIERNGKYYWYISTNWSGIGVAVSDRPQGPCHDALGKPLLTNEDCFASSHSWACIDPTVFIDDDGQIWLFWGNGQLYYAKLKENMVEIDGDIKQIKFENMNFTEAPWVHKFQDKYYLSYATGFPEKIAYAMSDNIEGPYEYKGILNEIAGNSNTNHQAIVNFKDQWYFIYHNGGIQPDGSSYSRSVCIDSLFYNQNGTMKRIRMTTEGVDKASPEEEKDGNLEFRNWAPTPPMGWNSWDSFGPSVTEKEVKANADYMAENLKDFGWEYVIVDIRWYVDNQTTGHYNSYENSDFVLDEYGRYIPSPKRFPSAAGDAGFKPLADYMHSLGLKFGIHIMRGVPKEAVFNKMPIKGTDKTAADIYSTESECTWLQDNYTIVKGKPGAQEYYNSIFDLYASWGVDFVKVDDLSRPYHADEIEMIRKAINQTGRPIVFSMSPGATPIDKHEHAANHANMWRNIDDFWDNWAQLNYSFVKCAEWAPYIQPGAWPDADMLPLGKFIRGERATNRYTKFTKDEQYTLMTLWIIFKSPLMFGGNLPDNDAFTDSLITNREVSEVHANSINNREWFNKNDLIGWAADDPERDDKFVAVFNSAGDGFVGTKNLLYRSGTISTLTDGFGKDIDIKLPEDSEELYLIVNDGGDGYTYDHADWINPTVYLANGDSIKLTDLKRKEASAGWGKVSVNKSISGGDLKIKGTTYENGIGTHSQSIIQYKLPKNTVRFKAFAGLDIGGTSNKAGSTIEFMISTKDPSPTREEATGIPVNLKDLGFSGECTIRDLWHKKDKGTFSGSEFKPTINYHGSGLYRISPVSE